MTERPMMNAVSRIVSVIWRWTTALVLSQKFWWNSGTASMCFSLSSSRFEDTGPWSSSIIRA
ncbi:hypothetical protein PF007_g31188 [Phytophthora fragariae]|uniref:Uncharacterized protein n=1 Tax=Phytophthora fragariae TaxID=53985 RepID=A0A6A3PTY6_9STRA|nr:hypothetical protein PF007_g31188 [Phytophthora fragariae]KAE9089891.1 hypothetical protein PF006_g25267 [Phytophthora fragariae]KAE9278013.1 hypothetical protein PF001_g25371 [Phytophthora fragariae]KAE9281172.1 hypothetical protein PF008_g27950 [Phytophthora fragariae]